MNNPNSPNYGPQNVNQPYPPHQSPQKPKWSTKKKFGVGAAIVLGIGVIGGAIGGGTSDNDSDKNPAVSAQVEDHATYEVEQQRTTAPVPERTYDANPGKPADDIDDIYVDLLRDEGIHASDKTLIEAGRDGVCVLAGEVDSFTELMIVVMDATGFDGGDAGTLIGASFAAYCPEYEWLLDQAQGRGI